MPAPSAPALGADAPDPGRSYGDNPDQDKLVHFVDVLVAHGRAPKRTSENPLERSAARWAYRVRSAYAQGLFIANEPVLERLGVLRTTNANGGSRAAYTPDVAFARALQQSQYSMDDALRLVETAAQAAVYGRAGLRLRTARNGQLVAELKDGTLLVGTDFDEIISEIMAEPDARAALQFMLIPESDEALARDLTG